MIAAHPDTVFPEGTDVHVTRNGNVLKGPGIYDDCRGLAALVGVAQALDAGKVQTTGTITFVADTGEEGLGDLPLRHMQLPTPWICWSLCSARNNCFCVVRRDGSLLQRWRHRAAIDRQQ